MASVDALAAVPLFSSLDEEQLVNLANGSMCRTRMRESGLSAKARPATRSSFSSKEQQRSRPGTRRWRNLQRVIFFGEVAILGDGRRTATVTSTSPVRLLVLFGTEFRQLEAAHPEIASRITETMQARAGQVTELA